MAKNRPVYSSLKISVTQRVFRTYNRKISKLFLIKQRKRKQASYKKVLGAKTEEQQAELNGGFI